MHLTTYFWGGFAFHGYLAAQEITDITQVPAYTALASCPAQVVSSVIDDSLSPICPAGSPPKCFCDNEANSSEWEAQISTNILNNCLTSPRAGATQAAAVFASFCSLALAAATTVSTPLSTPQPAASSTTGPSSTSQPATSTPISTSQVTASSSPDLVSPSTSSPAETSSGSSATTTASSKGSPHHKLPLELGIGIGVGVPLLFVICLLLYRKFGEYHGSTSVDMRRMRKANKYIRRKPGAMEAIERL